MGTVWVRPTAPQRLLRRLDDLGALLARRGDAIALIGLGSVGVDLDRLDDHSDLDFFVIVEDGARQRYLGSIDWLEELSPVAFSFPNTVDGRKVLFADGLYAEYAVFTLDGVAACVAGGKGRLAARRCTGRVWPRGARPGPRRTTPCRGRRTRRSQTSTSVSIATPVARPSAPRG